MCECLALTQVVCVGGAPPLAVVAVAVGAEPGVGTGCSGRVRRQASSSSSSKQSLYLSFPLTSPPLGVLVEGARQPAAERAGAVVVLLGGQGGDVFGLGEEGKKIGFSRTARGARLHRCARSGGNVSALLMRRSFVDRLRPQPPHALPSGRPRHPEGLTL